MNRQQALNHLASWDPSTDDLPDAIALMMDDDPEVLAAFNARFEPIAELAAADGLADDTLVLEPPAPAPPARRARRLALPLGIGLLMAAGLSFVVLSTSALVMLQRGGESPVIDDLEADLEYYSGPGGVESGDQLASRENWRDNGELGAGEDRRRTRGQSTSSGIRTGNNDPAEPSVLIIRGKSSEEGERGRFGLESEGDKNADGDESRRNAEGRIEVRNHKMVVTGPSQEQYTDYGHHDFELVAQDPLSTFSIDVDTASYTNVRRKLNEGYLPPTAAVRIEEFVNYFPYDYPPPASDPFSVHVDGSPSPFNDRTHIVRIGVQGKRIPVTARKAVHLTFLVDTSGSMQSPDKLGLAKTTLAMLTDELEDGDTVALVAYAGSAGLILPPTPMSRKAEVMRAFDRLSAGGSTAMGAGIELAYAQAESTLREGAVNRVVVLSDGDANVGATRHSDMSAVIRGYAERGITLTTVGFGQGNYKDTTMERLANDGDGNYYYIDSEAEARRVFVDKLTGTMQVIAKDVKLQVDWNPEEVVAYRLLGYENRDIADRDFRNDRVDAGEIGSGHSVTALYEVALKEGAGGPLATVRVRNKAPGPDSPAVERSFPVARDALRRDLDETTRDFRIALSAATFAEMLRDSPHVHGQGFADLLPMARGAVRPEYDEDRELVALIARASQLSER